ncbi:MAG: hypothetical protein LBS77_01075 [Desulfovibrio sp.]|jgi:hypothetical protein|nr:hypothetical protein [Desulfovibrio sp.]
MLIVQELTARAMNRTTHLKKACTGNFWPINILACPLADHAPSFTESLRALMAYFLEREPRHFVHAEQLTAI